MLLFGLLLCHIILNQMKTQEPRSASGVVDQRVEVWGELGVLGGRFCFTQGPPELWLRAGCQPRGQNNPKILCSKYTTLQNHNSFLREQRETWRMTDKPDIVRRAKEWRRFFSKIAFVVLYDIFPLRTSSLPFYTGSTWLLWLNRVLRANHEAVLMF